MHLRGKISMTIPITLSKSLSRVPLSVDEKCACLGRKMWGE